MKKILIVLSLVLALSCLTMFAGCSETDDLSGTIAIRNFSVKAGNHVTTFETFGEAWKYANENTSVDVSIICGEDVNAENGKFGDYGELTVNERTGTLTIDLNDNTINRGLTSADDSGAVFAFINKTGTVTIKNGTITGGNKTQHGGGIYVDSDNLNLTLKNVTITGNTAGINGGGMYINGCTATVTLNDVTVTGNTAGFGGGVHWDAWSYEEDSKMAYLQLCGNIQIKNNSVTGDADYSNLVISPFPNCSSLLSFDGMSEESEIHLAFETDIDMPFTGSLFNKAETYSKCFVSERSSLKIGINSNSCLYLQVDEKNNTRIAARVYRDSWGYGEYFTSCASAWTEADSHKAPVTMTLYMDWTANENGNLGEGNGFHDGAILAYSRDDDEELTLDLNGHTINRGLTKETARENGCIFYLSDGYSPHITVKNGTLTGGANTKHGGAIDDRADHGTFWLDNVTVTGNYSAKEGGAIYYYCDANYLCLRDTTITGNESGEWGAVYTEKDNFTQTFYLQMYGKVKIKDNSGGELCLYNLIPTACMIPIYTDFSDDIEEQSIMVTYVKSYLQQKYLAIADGDPEKTRKAFSHILGTVIRESDGVTYVGIGQID